MGLHRWNPRRDANEPEIVKALRAVGAQAFQISGSPAPDVIVWFRGRAFAMEIKSERGKKRKDEAHPDVPWPVVTSVQEALAVIGVETRG